MIVETSVATSTDPSPKTLGDVGVDAPGLQAFIFALFFIFGGVTSLNDVLIPKLKALFTLDHAQAMLVQSAFFAAYFLVSLPAVAMVRRLGYLRSASLGLLTMTAGCLLFIPASHSGAFGSFLLALFVLAAGITVVQVVANPLISLLGPVATASSRLTFAQFFNSVGTTVFPYVGSIIILGALAHSDASVLSLAARRAFRAAETTTVVRTYVALALVTAAVAAVVWRQRGKLVEDRSDERGPLFAGFNLLGRPRFAFGVLCIFVYVGAEVAIGSLIVNYLEQRDVMALGAEAAGKHVPFYWGGAMLGRFVGAYLLRVISPGKVLAGSAAGALVLLAAAAGLTGPAAGWALLAVGLWNSIMFPTIFTLASEGLGARAADGSGVICMSIVGGAVIPPLAGRLADLASLRVALAAPAFCYLLILLFGVHNRKPAAR